MPDIKLTFATTNAHKLGEVALFFEQEAPGSSVSVSQPGALKDVAETGQSWLENAHLKAQAVTPEADSQWVLAEDSGLTIPALAGQYGHDPFPGLHSTRWYTPEIGRALGLDVERLDEWQQRNHAIFKLMAGRPNREAFYVCGMVLYRVVRDEGRFQLTPAFEAEETLPLWVNEQPELRGENGFGYDPVMLLDVGPHARQVTVAQLPAAEKARISQRGKAIQKVWQYLLSQTAEVPA